MRGRGPFQGVNGPFPYSTDEEVGLAVAPMPSDKTVSVTKLQAVQQAKLARQEIEAKKTSKQKKEDVEEEKQGEGPSDIVAKPSGAVSPYHEPIGNVEQVMVRDNDALQDICRAGEGKEGAAVDQAVVVLNKTKTADLPGSSWIGALTGEKFRNEMEGRREFDTHEELVSCKGGDKSKTIFPQYRAGARWNFVRV